MTDEIVTQFTEIGRDLYPGYVAIRRNREDGSLTMVTRSSGHAATVTMPMSAAALRRMAGEILARIPADREVKPPSLMPTGCDCGSAIHHAPGEQPFCHSNEAIVARAMKRHHG